MIDEKSLWLKAKNDYLGLIEQALEEVEYPKRYEILTQVERHLEQKYAELPPEDRTWESFRQIITEMGPPEDYAVLLHDDTPRPRQSVQGRHPHKLLITVLLVVLSAAAVWFIINAPKILSKLFPPAKPVVASQFKPDDRVLGKWFTIDFVKTIDTFTPAKKFWQGDLYLKTFDFKPKGTVQWCTGTSGQKSNGYWTNGKLDPNNPIPGLYEIRAIDGNEYLFTEWISGDVTIRGMKPQYYVLSRDPQKVPFIMAAAAEKKEEAPAQSEPKPQPQTIVKTEPNIVIPESVSRPQSVQIHAYIIQFRSKGSIEIQDHRKLLDAFNQNYPSGVRTHHYRSQQEDGRLTGYICTDNQAGVQAIRQMLETSNTLQLLNVIGVTQAEFETYCQSGPASLAQIKPREVAAEPTVYGKWLAVDYIRKADDFVPGQQQWKKKLLLKEMQFTSPSTAYWIFTNDVIKQTTFGESTVQSVNDHAAKYFKKTLEGQEYLFVEWTTQDVVEKGQVPWLYVLKRQTVEPGLDTGMPQSVQTAAAVESSDVLGKWTSVDFVRQMEDFDPGRKSWQGEMFLTGLEFQTGRQMWCSFNDSSRFKHTWTPGRVDVGESRPALYTVKEINGDQYMFFEWISGDVTIRGQKPCYYVLKKTSGSSASVSRKTNLGIQTTAAVESSDVLGKWTSVDFVRQMEDFDPGRKSWQGEMFLTGLEFQTGRQMWCSFNDSSRFKHSWTPGKVDTGESRPALYTVKEIDGNQYMFFEWISGDVTIRGQKPCYYVLKKTSGSSASSSRKLNLGIQIGADYCTMNFIESRLGRAEIRDDKMLKYPAKGFDFVFSNNGILSEVHLNRGYEGQLKTGISLTSTAQDVFRIYGKPAKTIKIADLHGINDERILYRNDNNMSRIYYGNHGLIFWFRDDSVTQIVIFKGEVEAGL